jgi:porphobilinogen synthase
MEKEDSHSNQRRVRANRHIRELTSDVILSHKDFIQPLFVDEFVNKRTAIPSLHEINSDTIASALEQIESDLTKGVSKFLLFPVPLDKSENHFNFEFALKAIREIRKTFGDRVWLAADVCLCAYTSHGHCGIMNAAQDKVLNAETVAVLADYALQLARAGADCIAPSDMMDGRVKAIRQVLNANGFDQVAIMSYSAKFSSQFYGPFRDACRSTPGNGPLLKDRKTYQVSIFNKSDGLESALRDSREDADILMVKPALPYLDLLCSLKNKVHQPLAVYHVSGEYQSIELLALQNSVERSRAHVEVWTSMKRAGANIIISYAARHARQWIDEIEY